MDPRSRSGSGGSLSGTVRGAAGGGSSRRRGRAGGAAGSVPGRAGAGSSERQFGRRFGREKREYFDCEGGEE